MSSRTFAVIGGGVGALGLALGALTMASADDQPTPSPTSSTQVQEQRGPGGMGETPLTGTDAEKVTAAAQAAVPGGTVIRVETDSDGVYEAHVQRADGTEVEVKMDKKFTVTSVEEHGGLPGTRDDTTSTDSAA